MIKITAYKTSDGQLFENERQAEDHQKDIIGEMLDDLIPNDDRGNITRSDKMNILLKLMDDPNLSIKVTKLYKALNFKD